MRKQHSQRRDGAWTSTSAWPEVQGGKEPLVTPETQPGHLRAQLRSAAQNQEESATVLSELWRAGLTLHVRHKRLSHWAWVKATLSTSPWNQRWTGTEWGALKGDRDPNRRRLGLSVLTVRSSLCQVPGSGRSKHPPRPDPNYTIKHWTLGPEKISLHCLLTLCFRDYCPGPQQQLVALTQDPAMPQFPHL